MNVTPENAGLLRKINIINEYGQVYSRLLHFNQPDNKQIKQLCRPSVTAKHHYNILDWLSRPDTCSKDDCLILHGNILSKLLRKQIF